jgi:anti-sigma factor ChrR (cupin superfamily)
MLATTLNAALLDIQVLQAPHIAEADDAAMTRIETRMQESARTARAAFEQLEAPAAAAALDRFMALNDELIKLSRRNSDVKSLALSLGQKRWPRQNARTPSLRSTRRSPGTHSRLRGEASG